MPILPPWLTAPGTLITRHPRPYDWQARAFDGLVHGPNGLRHFPSVIQEAATGAGKSDVICGVAVHYARAGAKVLVLTNRDALVHDVHTRASATGAVAGVRVGLVKQKVREWNAPVVVASVQSCQKHRLSEIPRFDLVVTDETHHAPSRMWQGVYAAVAAQNPEWRHFGVTATPHRRIGEFKVCGLGEHFASELPPYRYADAVEDGIIVPIRGVAVSWKLAPADLANAPSGADGDYVMTQAVVDMMSTPGAIEAVIADFARVAVSGRGVLRTLAFCCNTMHADMMAAAFVRAGYRALAVHRKLADADERVARWRRGEVDVIFSSDLFLEGFDAPEVEYLLKLRPTKSVGRGMQMFGRGTRKLGAAHADTREGRLAAIAASPKPFCLLSDYAHDPRVSPFGPGAEGVREPKEPKGGEGLDDAGKSGGGAGPDTGAWEIVVGGHVSHPSNPQFGVGTVTAIDGDRVTVRWANGHEGTHPRDNLAPPVTNADGMYVVVGTEGEEVWHFADAPDLRWRKHVYECDRDAPAFVACSRDGDLLARRMVLGQWVCWRVTRARLHLQAAKGGRQADGVSTEYIVYSMAKQLPGINALEIARAVGGFHAPYVRAVRVLSEMGIVSVSPNGRSSDIAVVGKFYAEQLASTASVPASEHRASEKEATYAAIVVMGLDRAEAVLVDVRERGVPPLNRRGRLYPAMDAFALLVRSEPGHSVSHYLRQLSPDEFGLTPLTMRKYVAVECVKRGSIRVEGARGLARYYPAESTDTAQAAK